MKKRPFGKTGFSTSEVGLGCWQLGGMCWGDIEPKIATGIMTSAVESGVNFFDTADKYGEGRSEELIGKFIADCSEEIFVATKIGRFPQPWWPENFTRETMTAHTEASLRRLGVEALDLVQLHTIPTEELEKGDVFETLRELKSAGKIKRFGASVESMEQAQICMRQEDLDSLQIIFNIFRRKPIETIFEKAKADNIAIIARVPLASGLLSGKLSRDTRFADNDHRNFNREGERMNIGETFAGLPYRIGVETANLIRPMVPDGMTMAQMALRWILDFEAVSVVIPGASRPSQAADNAAASDLPPLSEDLHRQLAELYANDIAQHIRGPY